MIKTAVDFLTTPSSALLVLVALALLALLLHRRRLAISCLVVSLTGFVAFGFTALSEVMIAPLTSRFPPVDLATAAPPFGLIVLGGGMDEAHAIHYGTPMELTNGGEAIPITALLAQRYPAARIILSDGNGTDFPPAPFRPSDGMLRVLQDFGVARDRIMVDTRSPTTAARVINTLAMVGDDRDQVWWVITPAHRMPRVIGTYRAKNFSPVAYPIDFKWIPPIDFSYTYAFLDGLQLSDMGAHEWRGLLFYYLKGRIDTLFPAP